MKLVNGSRIWAQLMNAELWPALEMGREQEVGDYT